MCALWKKINYLLYNDSLFSSHVNSYCLVYFYFEFQGEIGKRDLTVSELDTA